MPSTAKPKLAVLATPLTGTFPSDSLPSAKTPLSAVLREPLGLAALPSAGLPSAGMASPFGGIAMIKSEDALAKTPITPPIAYLDFLKLASPGLAMASPPLTCGAKSKLNRTSTGGSTQTSSEDSAEETAEQDLVDSAPSTATSETSDCSCDCDHVHKSPTGRAPAASNATSPFSKHPMSAPPTGPTAFPSLRIPPSPAAGNADSPVQSPFSARSVRSPFDWDAALKARRFAEANTTTTTKTSGHHHSHSCSKSSSNSRTSVRHIREVVTRTVTYTPRMDPAPKGKRRKVQ